MTDWNWVSSEEKNWIFTSSELPTASAAQSADAQAVDAFNVDQCEEPFFSSRKPITTLIWIGLESALFLRNLKKKMICHDEEQMTKRAIWILLMTIHPSTKGSAHCMGIWRIGTKENHWLNKSGGQSRMSCRNHFSQPVLSLKYFCYCPGSPVRFQVCETEQ